MKISILVILIVASLASCNPEPTKLSAQENVKGLVYGDSVMNDNVIELTALSTAMGEEDRLDLKVKGKVDHVYPAKHWLAMKLNNGEEMLISFEDSTLKVPATLKGKEVILDGYAYSDTLSIDDQIAYAQEAGKTPEEVAKITTPKISVLFKAKGLVVLDSTQKDL